MGGFKKFFEDESGQGLVEYGLLLTLASIAAIAIITVLGPKVADMFTINEL